MTDRATFAAGCFWGVEARFRKLDGVLETTVGYTGGHVENPTYKEVCAGQTGHAEALQIAFDPAHIGYTELLMQFWTMHDPTTLNRQGPDVGSQYRSAVFYHTPEQKAQAEETKAMLDASGCYTKPIVTEITSATEFYPAEDYHQRYYEKHSGASCSL